MPARSPALRPYRIAVYVIFGIFCGLLFLQLIRSVVGDLYGRTAAVAVPATPVACLDDVDRLYGQLAARAVQPAPGGLESGALAREWDLWTRRWEAEVDAVSARCRLDDTKDPVLQPLGDAVDALEDLRRELDRTGEEAAHEAARVRDGLAAARAALKR